MTTIHNILEFHGQALAQIAVHQGYELTNLFPNSHILATTTKMLQSLWTVAAQYNKTRKQSNIFTH